VDIEEWQWDNIMNVNVKGPFFLLKQIAPIMKAQGGGAIINVASYMGIRTEETLGVYCISKAAVLHMTRAMAKEWGKWNIRVNSICPGAIIGDRQKRVIEAAAKAEGKTVEQVTKERATVNSMRTFIPPEDVAACVLYLDSPGAERVSGQVIAVDGHIPF